MAYSDAAYEALGATVDVGDWKLNPRRLIYFRDTVIGMLEKNQLPLRFLDPEAKTDGIEPELLEIILHNLRRADLVLWKPEIFFGATEGSEVFEQTPFVMPEDFSPQLWSWEEAITTESYDFVLLGLLLFSPYPGTISGVSFQVEPDDLEEIVRGVRAIRPQGVIDYLFARPAGFLSDGVSPQWFDAQMLACYKFLHLPFVSSEPQQAYNRAERRRMIREGEGHKIQTVRIVTLRKNAPRSIETQGGEKPDWSCHWLVRGHWRNQYLPSTRDHKPTWIDAYLKGDDSKPFHAPAERIYRAKR